MKAALRHLKRNRRRTILTLLAVMIPVYFLIFMFGFANANLNDMFETATRFDTGHLQIQGVDPDLTGSALPLMRDPSDALEVLTSVDEIEWSTVRLDLPAMASVGGRTQTVYVRGVVPEEIEPVSNMADTIVDGEFLTSESQGAILGEELADLLKAGVGDDVILLGVHPDASLGAIRVPVVGIYHAPETAMGRTIAYVSLATARQLARSETAATSIVARIEGVRGPRDTGRLGNVVASLRSNLPAGYKVEDWLELVPFVSTYMSILTPMLWMIAVIFFALGALVVLNTVYLSVMERTREIGLIISLGASRARVIRMILSEAGLIAVGGAIYGVILGVGLILIVEAFGGIPLWGAAAEMMRSIGMTPVFHMSIDVGQALFSALAMAVVAVLAAWIPAWRASKLEPVEAMRYVE